MQVAAAQHNTFRSGNSAAGIRARSHRHRAASLVTSVATIESTTLRTSTEAPSSVPVTRRGAADEAALRALRS